MPRVRKYLTFQQPDGTWLSAFVADTQIKAWKETIDRAKAVNGDAVLKDKAGRVRLLRQYRQQTRQTQGGK